MAEETGKKNQQGTGKKKMFLLSLCWIVLFDLECSERRALCNISSTHMAVCVTAKHTGGSGSSGGGGGGGWGGGGGGSGGGSGSGVLR